MASGKFIVLQLFLATFLNYTCTCRKAAVASCAVPRWGADASVQRSCGHTYSSACRSSSLFQRPPHRVTLFRVFINSL